MPKILGFHAWKVPRRLASSAVRNLEMDREAIAIGDVVRVL